MAHFPARSAEYFGCFLHVIFLYELDRLLGQEGGPIFALWNAHPPEGQLDCQA